MKPKQDIIDQKQKNSNKRSLPKVKRQWQTFLEQTSQSPKYEHIFRIRRVKNIGKQNCIRFIECAKPAPYK